MTSLWRSRLLRKRLLLGLRINQPSGLCGPRSCHGGAESRTGVPGGRLAKQGKGYETLWRVCEPRYGNECRRHRPIRHRVRGTVAERSLRRRSPSRPHTDPDRDRHRHRHRQWTRHGDERFGPGILLPSPPTHSNTAPARPCPVSSNSPSCRTVHPLRLPAANGRRLGVIMSLGAAELRQPSLPLAHPPAMPRTCGLSYCPPTHVSQPMLPRMLPRQ